MRVLGLSLSLIVSAAIIAPLVLILTYATSVVASALFLT
jgi:hypothetical protein